VAYRSLRAQPGFRDFAYDFLAPAAERDAARLRILRGWTRSRGSVERPTGDAILIGPDGELRWKQFNRLVRARDDTPISLSE
jgi:hypothetical protein